MVHSVPERGLHDVVFMSSVQPALHTVRRTMATAAGRPAWAAGLRAAIATVAPLLVASALGSSGGMWMVLAGFNGALSDRGGPYHSRAVALALLTVATAVAVMIATAAHGNALLAVVVTLAVAAISSLARVWGVAGAGASTAVLCTYLIALPVPVTMPHEVLTRAAYILVGGAWAMVLSLVLWPLRPYRPLRYAVASSYDALADYVAAVRRRTQEGTAPDAWTLRPEAMALRGAVDQARDAVAATRRGGPGMGERGERLLVLNEIVDQLFARVLAVSDALDAAAGESSDAAAVIRDAAARALESVNVTARSIARSIRAERNEASLRPPATARPQRSTAEPHLALASELIQRIGEYAGVAASTTIALNDDRAGEVAGTATPDLALPPNLEHRPFTESLRAVLTPGALLGRHALRVAVATAAAVWIAAALGLQHDYWMTITVVIILQPYTGATAQKAVQRVAGTVVGAIVAAALGTFVHDPRAVLAITFLFVIPCVALLPVNYAAYSVFLTPAFVLLAEASVGDWHLAHVRVVNTLLGGALALIASWLLWPSPESRRLPDYLAAAVRACRAYLDSATSLSGAGTAEAARQLRGARRAIAMAAADAEESFDRFLAEQRRNTPSLEAAMTLLTYIRRFAVSTAALSVAGQLVTTSDSRTLEPFARVATGVLDDLAAALERRRPPAPFPVAGSVPMPPASTFPLLHARAARLARQLKSLHDAVEQWTAGEISSPS